MQAITYILMITLIGLQTACSSLTEKMESIQVGDDKSKLLDVLGSPNHNLREDGKNIWTYHIFENNKRQTKLFTLREGRVIKAEYAKDKSELDVKVDEANDIKSYEKSVLERRKNNSSDFQDISE